ncbi:MAG: ABC transporter ATP-binding protein [Anaerolineae bacterium]|nr:ABC transporter ATP-binding protein [Anaerolineae bacterium]
MGDWENRAPGSGGAGKQQVVLEAIGVRFGYEEGKGEVLRALSVAVPAGGVTALLGPNGSGKTTLLRLMLGVLRPSGGEIWLAGRPLAHYSRRERSQTIGLLPQDEHIPFDFSVVEYVLLGRAPYLGPLEMPGEADRQVALDALDAVGMAALGNRPLPNLSGGERQLTTLARALAQQPQVLLMDEPAAHLDLSNQGRLLDIVRGLAARGVTTVLTTHDPNLAAAVAGHAVLIRDGQVLASGPPEMTLTEDRLSATYGVPVGVYRVDGRKVILLN